MGWTDSSIVSGVVIICMLITASACWLTVRCVQRETSPLQTVRRLNWISLLVVLHVVVTAVGPGVSGRLNRPPHEFIPEVTSRPPLILHLAAHGTDSGMFFAEVFCSSWQPYVGAALD